MHGLLSSFIIVINVTSSRELKNVKYLNADSVTIIKMDEMAFISRFVFSWCKCSIYCLKVYHFVKYRVVLKFEGTVQRVILFTAKF